MPPTHPSPVTRGVYGEQTNVRWYPGHMGNDANDPTIEMPESGYPIEIYTDERIREFLAEDELTPEQKKRIDEKLKESKALKSPPKSGRQ